KMAIWDDVAQPRGLTICEKGVQCFTGLADWRAEPYDRGASTLGVEWRDPLESELENFLDCVRGGGRPRADGWQGLRVVTVLDAAQRSLDKKGVPMEIKAASA
ncbi:MAG: oxidoreductase, partial [Verrucomicrobiae bacterium]|nr:oxidoreductase [Verrucomicrobiae bacterium]